MRFDPVHRGIRYTQPNPVQERVKCVPTVYLVVVLKRLIYSDIEEHNNDEIIHSHAYRSMLQPGHIHTDPYSLFSI